MNDWEQGGGGFLNVCWYAIYDMGISTYSSQIAEPVGRISLAVRVAGA